MRTLQYSGSNSQLILLQIPYNYEVMYIKGFSDSVCSNLNACQFFRTRMWCGDKLVQGRYEK